MAKKDMQDSLPKEELWYLERMISQSEKDFAEGRVYTHDDVKQMLKARKHDNHVVP